ncbi:YckD family protein [Anaerobacillus sp. MEB173]|uniref:YckD family protein n=1 Tax=Anaerobacillus sp. MEB173 TaxID=3383345 RepID=UPI003F91042B
MKKWCIGLTAAALLCVGMINPAFAEEESIEHQEVNEVTLTEEQKQELSELHKSLFEQKKEVINKYVEYGVFTKEKGDKIISKFEKHHEKLKESGYIPRWDHHKKKCHCKNDEDRGE